MHCLIKPSLFVLVFALCVSAQIKIVPIAEGWAKNQINSVIFRKNSLASFRERQYAAFYDENSRVVIASRKLNSTKWEVRPTQFSGQTADAHNSISLAIDGQGFLHLAWNHHDTPLNYARSSQPELLEFAAPEKMIGVREDKVTYPEFYSLPNGDLLFFYRDGSSGSGNLILNRYTVKTRKWKRVQENLLDGEGRRNAHPQMTIDSKGAIHLSWVWRETPNVATNHDLCYAVSRDGGATWYKSSGEKYQLPIRADNAEYIQKIPPSSELINQTSMTTDERDFPYIASYWRDVGSIIPQYRVVYFDGQRWRQSQISNRRTAFSLSGAGTKKIPISRPQIVAFSPESGKTKIVVVFRDEERGNLVSAATSENLAENSWQIQDLIKTSVGMWEPAFDPNIWNHRRMLHLFIQKVGQGDGEKLENLPPQMISVLEWKP